MDQSGQVAIGKASDSQCDVTCFAAACKALSAGGCADAGLTARVAGHAFRVLDATCSDLAPAQLHCHWVRCYWAQQASRPWIDACPHQRTSMPAYC